MTVNKKTLVLGLGLIVLCVASFFAGGWLVLNKISELRKVEDEFYLRFSIDQLAMLQTGDTERLRRILELRAQQFLMPLMQRNDWDDIPADTQKDLVVAKHYFRRFPVLQPGDHFQATLEKIPNQSIDPESCSPAVKKLIEAGEL